MELIVKVNVKSISNGKNSFNVYNTYIKDEQSGEWVKFNVKFKQGQEKPIVDSYVYADDKEISINEIGTYPTVFINKVNKIVKLRFDGKNLAKYFRQADSEKTEESTEIVGDPFDEGDDSDSALFDNYVEEKDLPFDKEEKKGKK